MSKRRKRKLPPFLHLPVYWAARAAIGAMLIGDLESNLRAARAFGRAWARFEPRRVQRAMDNIAAAFPEMPAGERHEHAIESYEHLFMLAVEMAYTPRMMTHYAWSECIRVGTLGRTVRHLVSVS